MGITKDSLKVIRDKNITLVRDLKIKTKTTTICNVCLNSNLVLLKTCNEKVCTDCGNTMEWTLEEGQRSLL